MHSDHRQPGSKLNRPIVKPSSWTTSIRVFAGARTSSGDAWDFTSNFVTVTGAPMSSPPSIRNDQLPPTGITPPKKLLYVRLALPGGDNPNLVQTASRCRFQNSGDRVY